LSVQDYCAASLDGYIAELDDTIEWLTDYEAVPPGEDVTSVEGGYDDFYAGVGALVSGSVTYDFILRELERGSEWPYVGKPCWVLSSRKLPVPDVDGIDVRIRNAPVAELFDAMLNSAGEGNLWVVGGGNVASQFADEGLLDEVLVTVLPVVLGDGATLRPAPAGRPDAARRRAPACERDGRAALQGQVVAAATDGGSSRSNSSRARQCATRASSRSARGRSPARPRTRAP
jgi:dihydrofolate reductase